MIKAAAFFKRKAGMSVEAFQDYWRTRHPEAVTALPGIRRYVQSHTLLSGYRNGEPCYDGLAEVWFDDLAAMQSIAGTEVHRRLLEDEDRFIERATMELLLTEEHVVKDAPLPERYVKSIAFLTRRPDLSVMDFQRYWRERHGPLASRIPMVLRYVQSHVRPGGYARGHPAYDGLAVTWFESTDAMRASARTAEYEATRADEPNFLAPGELPVIITREHIIVA